MTDSINSYTVPTHQKPVQTRSQHLRWNWLLGLLVLHVLLTLIMDRTSQIATLHALATVGLGLFFALRNQEDYAIYAAAYLVGGEVLWRMTDASVFWEFGKYAVILVLGLLVLRRKPLFIPRFLMLYAIALIPAAIPVIVDGDIGAVRRILSFNLSGHIAIFVSILFFYEKRLSRENMYNILTMVMLPTVGVATIVTQSLLTTEINWIIDSNTAASGGYGPNQVSIALGLAALMLAMQLVLFNKHMQRHIKLFALGIMLWFVALAVFTFSRGGVLNFAFGAIVLLVASFSSGRISGGLVAWLFVAGAIFYLIIPYMNDFTGGSLGLRYVSIVEIETSGRDQLLEEELEIFLDNPLLGLGVGRAREYRGAASHTEYTRLLSEHGILGFVALLSIGCTVLTRYFNSRIPISARIIMVTLATWTAFYFVHSGMRTVAPSFLIGLAFAIPILQEQPDDRD